MKEFTHLFSLGADCTAMFMAERFGIKYKHDLMQGPCVHSCIYNIIKFVDTICDRNANVLDYNDIVLAPQRKFDFPATVNIKTGQAFAHDWFSHSSHTLDDIRQQVPEMKLNLDRRFDYLRYVLDNEKNCVLFIYVGDGELTEKRYGCHLTYHRDWYSLDDAQYCVNTLRDNFKADINLLYLNSVEGDTSGDISIVHEDDHLVTARHNVWMGKSIHARSDLFTSVLYKDLKRIYGNQYFTDFDNIGSDVMRCCFQPQWKCRSDILCMNLDKNIGYRLGTKEKFSIQSYNEKEFTIKWDNYGTETFIMSETIHWPLYLVK